MLAFAYVSLYVAVPWLVLVYLHTQLHSSLNYWQVSMVSQFSRQPSSIIINKQHTLTTPHD